MSTITDALEVEVAAIRAIQRQPANARSKSAADAHFARILTLIAPRIRHFIRAYGLYDWREDAEQACAIGVHRAILAYDPAKARFTTFVTWQLRGELQGLRFRVRTETRDSARSVGASLVSLEVLSTGGEDGDGAGWQIADADALERTEALASDLLARRACGRMLDDYVDHMRSLAARQRARAPRRGGGEPLEMERIETRLARERAIIAAHMIGEDGDPEERASCGLTAEQKRQIARRATRTISERLGAQRASDRTDPRTFSSRSATQAQTPAQSSPISQRVIFA